MRESPEWFLEVDLDNSGEWTPLCGHRSEEEANRCKTYFQPMLAFSGKPMRVRKISNGQSRK